MPTIQTVLNFYQQNEFIHPYKHDIIGQPKEYLIYRRKYVVTAINYWESNINCSLQSKTYNVRYFTTELEIIDKELQKHK